MSVHDDIRRLYDELRDERLARDRLTRRVEAIERALDELPAPTPRVPARRHHARDAGLVVSSATVLAILQWVLTLVAQHLGVK